MYAFCFYIRFIIPLDYQKSGAWLDSPIRQHPAYGRNKNPIDILFEMVMLKYISQSSSRSKNMFGPSWKGCYTATGFCATEILYGTLASSKVGSFEAECFHFENCIPEIIYSDLH